MEILEGGALPIYSWAPGLEEGALRQATNCANLSVAFHHIAVMADGHQGYGVPVGAVLALDGAISPYAVGNDIGCGMALVPTHLTRGDLLAPVHARSGKPGALARDEVMGWVQASIPAGAEERRGGAGAGDATNSVRGLLGDAFEALCDAAAVSGLPLSTSQSTKADAGRPLDAAGFVARGVAQAGTLGSGNHFIELLAGPEDDVWVMLHSGSRGIGALICNNFHRMALAFCAATGQPLIDPGLAWLPAGDGNEKWGRVGACYQRALGAALDYAERNRRLMLEEVGRIIKRRFRGGVRWDGLVDIHHNDATLEEHFGSRVWIHRKGAVKAATGTKTIIPGSMGTGSYLGRGLGNPASFSSCSHGAGRRMSRGRARQELSLQQELERVRAVGGKVFASSREAVLDEMPAAYKDLDELMAAQSDLVEPVRRFTPLGTYKGAERARRGRRSKGWRPDEER